LSRHGPRLSTWRAGTPPDGLRRRSRLTGAPLRQRLERRDAELTLLDRAEDEPAELIGGVHADPAHVLRLPARPLRLVAGEMRVLVLDALAVLVDRRAEVLDLLEGEGLRRAVELVGDVHRRRDELRLAGRDLHL